MVDNKQPDFIKLKVLYNDIMRPWCENQQQNNQPFIVVLEFDT